MNLELDNLDNGRIDILNSNIDQFSFADKIPVKECVSYTEALTGTWENTPLSNAYFSLENIRILQNAIRKGIYDKSTGQLLIGEQNCDQLKIIMRSIYLQYTRNLNYDITKQISLLNDLVTKYSINQIYSDAISNQKYKEDASTMYNIMNHPSNTSVKDHTLELKRFF